MKVNVCFLFMFLEVISFTTLVNLCHANVILSQYFCVVFILDILVVLCLCRRSILMVFAFIAICDSASVILFCLNISYEFRNCIL